MNTVTIHIPAALTQFTNANNSITLQATSIATALESLVAMYPALQDHLFTNQQQIHSHFCLFLNNEHVVDNALIPENAILKIIPAMIGG